MPENIYATSTTTVFGQLATAINDVVADHAGNPMTAELYSVIEGEMSAKLDGLNLGSMMATDASAVREFLLSIAREQLSALGPE